MTIWVALLRAVNVAGVNRLPMEAFRDMLAGLGPGGQGGGQGLRDVKTYVQSGNAVFRSDLGAGALSALIADGVLAGFGFRPPVLMLTRDEIRRAIAANPFAAEAPDKVHVFFLNRELPKATDDFLKSVAVPGERFAYRGRILWLHLPDGIGRSRLASRVTNLPLDITARNMKSVQAIAALADKLASMSDARA